MRGLRITIRGIVQGVGFRPFIYILAKKWQLKGWVLNSSNGVEIEVTGEDKALNGFLQDIPTQKPPLARLDEIQSEYFIPSAPFLNFDILTSQSTPGDFIPVSPDVSICDDCLNEMFDPANRRFRYPFINCTNCGPRFTIIQNIPYDRPFTTMSGFEMCSDCRAEYENPLDRRFHAQPIACPVCGPQVWFESNGETLAQKNLAIEMARKWLREGKILAVKGLGGYHLACDAENPAAVERLRLRKKRIQKPFALMSFNIDIIEKHCLVTKQEREQLLSRVKPIVILHKNPETTIAESVAPNQKDLGFMLPYTPLHLLLLQPDIDYPEVFVMTSGNLSEEPIAYKDDDARNTLLPLADGFLIHDRPIHTRMDDSVIRIFSNKIYPIRRSRGYAPDPIIVNRSLHQVLAAGADLKNTFCLTRGKYAFLSHHIGDLENYATFQAYEENITHYQQLFRITPQMIACDLHPEYYSTRYAHTLAKENGNLPLVQVQHHHAHLAACLADNHWDSNDLVICFSFDGTGYGTDGAIWGGEVMLGNYAGFQRLYHLEYFPLPGGDMAIRNPARTAIALLSTNTIPWEDLLPPVRLFSSDERNILRYQLQNHINTIATSSMGRLFDAISALLNICLSSTYEGQAAMELEASINPTEHAFYEFDIQKDSFSPSPLLTDLCGDIQAGLPIPKLAAKFHNSIVHLVSQLAAQIRKQTGIDHVALSGGVWQNNYLLHSTVKILQANQFTVLTHHHVPTNDGGIALGQAMIANAFIENR